MKLLVLGGMHGNEPLGIELVRQLKQKPIPGVTAMIANPRAVRGAVRFTESDLNRSFGTQFPGTYETRRAKRLASVCRQYDMVLDFHNTQAADNDCSFVGPTAKPKLFDLAAKINLKRCVMADYDCINKACDNVLSVEISLNSPQNSSKYWYDQLRAMDMPGKAGKLERYRYRRRVTWAEQEALGLNWRPFEPISDKEKRALGIDGIIVPIFVGSRFTEYYATLISLESDI